MVKKQLFSIILIFLVSIGLPITKLSYSSNTTNDEIDNLKEDISNIPDECWKKPARIRRAVIIRKLTIVQALVSDENFEEAYDKLLNDIKPKLTGLKTDEYEDPWGNGEFKKPWLICGEYQEAFRLKCNDLLSYIKAGSVPEDDTTGPIITIVYHGSGMDVDPGFWEIIVEDPESGIDEVQISINGDLEFHAINLGGIQYLEHVISAWDFPTPVGTYVFDVTAKNNDKDYVGDQETSTYSEDFVIIDDDTTAPEITITYYGSGTEFDPGWWVVEIVDLESGIGDVNILINGYEMVFENLGGLVSNIYTIETPGSVGTHTIEGIVSNSDNDWSEDQEESSQSDTVDIIPDPFPVPL